MVDMTVKHDIDFLLRLKREPSLQDYDAVLTALDGAIALLQAESERNDDAPRSRQLADAAYASALNEYVSQQR